MNKNILKMYFYFMSLSFLPTCTYVHHMCTWCLWGSEEVSDPLEMEFTDGGKLPCGCWEPSYGPLQEPQVFLSAGPSLQPHFKGFNITITRTNVKSTSAHLTA